MIPIIVWRDGRQYLRVDGAEFCLPAKFDDYPIERQYRLIRALEKLRAEAVEFAARARALAAKQSEEA